MIKCNVCQLEKEDNNFMKYWHSTQQVFRIRKQCNNCFYLKRKKHKLIEVSNPSEIIQPVQPELAPVVLEYDTEIFRQCVDCGEWKVKDEQFTKYGKNNGYLRRCRKCTNEIEKAKYYEEMEAKGGSDKVPVKPGIFSDKTQREQTHQFLRLLGWKENSNGIWYKEGFKTEEGKWEKFNEETKVARSRRGTVLPKGPRKPKPKKYIPQEVIDGILEMTRSGCKLIRIREKYNVSKHIVWRIREENQLT